MLEATTGSGVMCKNLIIPMVEEQIEKMRELIAKAKRLRIR